MLNLIISYLFFFLAGFLGAMLGCYLFSKRKWSLTFNQATQSLELTQEGGKVEFLSDPTAEELDDLAKPALSKFLEQFKIKK
uniref:Uncharacterized protein n=1 Tax=viral metagenome TaxID=1070528 RepID=A0A6M3IN20_9ZZZZ